MLQRKSREEMRAGFKTRLKEEGSRKEGGYYANLFRKDISIPFMKNGEGYHTIDILDYIAGKNDPSPGSPAWCFEFYAYNNIGAGVGPILSLSKTFGLPDPIAEDRAKQIRNGVDSKALRSLDPSSPRAIFNVICSDSKEEEAKGVQVFHTSSYLFTDYVREMAKGTIRPGMEGIDPIVDFCDPVNGKSIKFKREALDVKTKYILHQFVDRPKGFIIDDKDLDKVFTLDELVHIPTYDEVCEYYYGKGQAMPGAQSLGGPKTEAPVQEDSGRKSRYATEPDGSEKIKEEPKKEEKEVRKEESINPCPSGHVYAKDIDKFPKDCEPCKSWRDCSRAKAALDSVGVAKPAEAVVEKKEEASAAPIEEGRRRRRG